MKRSAIIFDLDGTLVDSVYDHVTAWHHAFQDAGITLPAFEIHKRIGMSGTLMIDALCNALEMNLSGETRLAISAFHDKRYRLVSNHISPLPGATSLWAHLRERDIPWAIATSAAKKDADVLLERLALPDGAIIVTQNPHDRSKPSPEPIEEAAAKLNVCAQETMVVGDSVWDILASRRAGAFGVGVLTGGYGREELVAAGAYRVFSDVSDLSRRLDELGIG